MMEGALASACNMTSLTIDHSAYPEGGEGVEMELDPVRLVSAATHPYKDDGAPIDDVTIDCSAIDNACEVSISEPAGIAGDSTKLTMMGKLQLIQSQFLNKVTSKLKAIIKRPDYLQLSRAEEKAINTSSDNSTCAMSQTSQTSSNSSSTAGCNSIARSSITTSTCDFPEEMNDDAVLESYLVSNPWDAAKRGDYATLSYIANHEDSHIWIQADELGNVPLYYACTSYSQPNGAFGKYGLESVKLLVNLWPPGIAFPCALSEQNSSIHKDVLQVLSKSNQSEQVDKIWVDSISDVVPVSFLEDLGDDGYVEDY